MLKEKGFATVLVLAGIFVIGALAGGVYYLGFRSNKQEQSQPVITHQDKPQQSQKTQDLSVVTLQNETTNWITYTNKDDYYLIDYPATFKLSQEISSPIIRKSSDLLSSIQISAPCNYSADDQNKPDSCGGLETYHLIVSVETNLSNTSLDNWLKTSDLAPLKACKSISPNVKISREDYLGEKAIIYEYLSDKNSIYGCEIGNFQGDWQTGFIKEIVVPHKQKVYKISIFYTLKDKIFVKDLLKIPGTIKFLD